MDLAACSEHRYVPPRIPGQLEEASRRLAAHGVVILSAPPGSGRRTTALRLLKTVEGAPRTLELFDLEPEWSKPSVERLPKGEGQGYVLDMSEVSEGDPETRFGQDLINYGDEGRRHGWYLVILSSPSEWKGSWVESTLALTVPLSSPDARDLVLRELRSRSVTDREDWLGDSPLPEIWQSNPPAQEARRLARIIADADKRDVPRIVDEFRGWHGHIDGLLNKEFKGQGYPDLLSMRATVWAGALLNGGRSRSILKASDALLRMLQIPRASADVLGDATSSRRLETAGLTPRGEYAYHAEDKHELASAILQNLWEEFPTQRELLGKWAVAVAADAELPEEDARRAAQMLLQLATVRRDGDILDSIGRGLVGRRRSLAMEVLTTAALDAQIGAYVRNRLYLWAKSGSEETVKLVVDVCGGDLGMKKPEIALTRLRWAAGKSSFGSQPLAEAFGRLVRARPAEVGTAVAAWFEDDKLQDQAHAVFLALASSDEGAAFLVHSADTEKGRQNFVQAWQRLLGTDNAQDAAESQLTRWSLLADQGTLRKEALIDLLADVYEPKLHRNGLMRFISDDPEFMESFWGQVLRESILRGERGREGRAG
ncbi:hypothetical protein ACFWBI_16595 [Streptomyces sp. NPDC059982]|uniref:hypothetical protein n=1 Tax=unclassified Streptomyces TaxID=2593676 RepID=UPI0036AC2D75